MTILLGIIYMTRTTCHLKSELFHASSSSSSVDIEGLDGLGVLDLAEEGLRCRGWGLWLWASSAIARSSSDISRNPESPPEGYLGLEFKKSVIQVFSGNFSYHILTDIIHICKHCRVLLFFILRVFSKLSVEIYDLAD